MMRKTLAFSLLVFTIPLFVKAYDFQEVRKKIHSQFLEYRLSTPPNDSLTKVYLESMQADGTWESIDYTSTRRGNWPTTDHLIYLDEMARSYAHPKSFFYQNKELKTSILKGIEHWLDAGYTNKNWYPIYIRAPRHTMRVFLYLDDEIPDMMKEEAWEKMFKMLHMRRRGSNQVIAAEIEVMKGVYYDKQQVVEDAIEVLWSEVRLTTEEGIQPDWCYHQHGNQQQLGNYGLSYSGRVTEWAYILRDTPYQMSKEKLDIHSNFLLNGPAWFLWKGKMDIIASGRQFQVGDLENKFALFTEQYELMQSIDPQRKSQYEQIISEPHKLVGQKSYWRSDCAVHREESWMASLAMSSIRVVGTELTNMENFLGLHISDGRLLVTRTGQEYHHIAPLWDWHRLPGTTCDQKLDTLTPQRSTRTTSEFAGSLDNGKQGIAAMHYKRSDLKARKSWFFLEDAIVCLGADITGQTKGNVFTSIEQSNLHGDVRSSQGRTTNTTLQSGSWIHHNRMGYHLLNDTEVKIEHLESNWQKSFPTYDSIHAEGDVFSLYVDHGKNPDSDSYQYVIYPDIAFDKMDRTIAKSKTKVLSNTATVQAIQVKNQIMAVFCEAGQLELEGGRMIAVDAPCLFMLGKKNLRVADPVHQTEQINIEINKRQYLVQLPQGDMKGSSSIVNLK